MPKEHFAWRRFWCPRGKEYRLSDDGFLMDPESDLGRYWAENIDSFDKIQRFPCLVLLGEPGAGKSTALRSEWERLRGSLSADSELELWCDLSEFSSDERLVKEVFGSPQFESWRQGSRVLHLLLDGLDEARVSIPTIGKLLVSKLRGLDIQRLRLRIACRTADWPGVFEASLQELWVKEDVGLYELLPLRRTDVQLACGNVGIDSNEFLRQVGRLGISSFGSRPLTLKFLLNAFEHGKSLPHGRRHIYEQGCLRLAEETSEGRRDAGRLGKLTAEQRLEVAGRLAAVSILSGGSAFWTGPESDCLEGDLNVARIIGDFVGTDSTRVEMTRDAVLETLGTALFNSRGRERLGWSHQTYAEFLTARHLWRSRVPTEQALQLFLHPDGTGRVVPQLQEAAAWIASFDRKFFEALVPCDPDVLLRGDPAEATEEDRLAVATNLLRAFELGTLLSDREIRSLYSRLASPGLPSVLKPYICDQSRNPIARQAAVCIAEACNVDSLIPDIAALALNAEAPLRVRITAARVVADSTDGNARAALRPLVMGERRDDPDDELKGYALQATWPGYLTANELLESLKPPKNSSFGGSYDWFLRSSPTKLVKPDDLPAALVWARKYGPDDRISPFGKLAAEVLAQSLRHTDTPGVAEALAQFLASQWRYSCFYSDEITAELNAVEVRREVVRALYQIIAEDCEGDEILTHGCQLRPDDIRWLLEDLERVPATTQSQIARIVAHRLLTNDPSTLDSVLLKAKRVPVLAEELAPKLSIRLLDSMTAQEERRRYEFIQKAKAIPEDRPAVPRVDLIQSYVDRRQPESFFRVWALCHEVRGADAWEVLPGWNLLDTTLHDQIVSSAVLYLTEFGWPLQDDWWCAGNSPYFAVAGYAGFVVINRFRPDILESLEGEVWDLWMPAIVLEGFVHARAGADSKVLAAAYGKKPERFLEVLDEILEAQNSRSGHITLFGARFFWNDGIAERLLRKLESADVRLTSRQTLLRTLLEHGDNAAQHWAEDALSFPANDTSALDRGVMSALQLIEQTPDASWSLIWPVLTSNNSFLERVLAGIRASDSIFGFHFTSKLSASEVADLFLMLYPDHVAKVVPQDEDALEFGPIPQSLGRMLGTLAQRGTQEAVQAIRRIRQERPELDGLKWDLHQAEELLRRSTWTPLDPTEVTEVLRDPQRRIVRSGSDLLEVLIESLKRLENTLQDITPMAFCLWDKCYESPGDSQQIYRPKNEQALSNYLKHHLESELKERGILTNREVEIRPSCGGSPGERIDILVEVSVPSASPSRRETIRAIVEVKGIWNRDVKTAMETQLVDRYMNENGVSHGLFVVGWYQCPQWDERDYRSKSRPFDYFYAAQAELDAQAKALSNEDRQYPSGKPILSAPCPSDRLEA
jgi:hypothetical protein